MFSEHAGYWMLPWLAVDKLHTHVNPTRLAIGNLQVEVYQICTSVPVAGAARQLLHAGSSSHCILIPLCFLLMPDPVYPPPPTRARYPRISFLRDSHAKHTTRYDVGRRRLTKILLFRILDHLLP